MYNKSYYEANKERINEKHKCEYQLKKEEYKARSNSYYHNNKEIISEKQKIKYKLNIEKYKACNYDYFINNRDLLNEKSRLKYEKRKQTKMMLELENKIKINDYCYIDKNLKPLENIVKLNIS